MIPSLYTYNGTAINDGTNYVAKILEENAQQGSAEINFVKRPFSRPVYAGKSLNEYDLTIVLHMRGTVSSQIDTMKKLFDVEDRTQRQLIIKDTANSDKQYYVYATPKRVIGQGGRNLYITLAVADPVWLAVTETAASAWSVTASGQTKAVTVGGNVNAHPRITITPTAVKGSGYAYKRLVIVRNRVNEDLVNYPFELTNAGWDATALLNFTTNHVHINIVGGIQADDVTISYNSETGTFPTSGIAMIENEQIRYTGNTGELITGVTRGINGTTAAFHADGVQINQSLIQADGDDIRVFVDGKLTPSWTYGVGTSAQKVWISLDLKKKIDLTLKSALADDSECIFTLNSTTKLPNKGLLLIGTELIRYTSKTDNTASIDAGIRGANGTTAAVHAVNAPVYFIEHEIWIYYGNITLDDPTTNYEDWDNHKPIINLTSTNVSWVYATFRDRSGQRAGSFVPVAADTDNTIDKVNKSKWYSGVRKLMAATATEMGAVISAWKSGALWKKDNATILWSINNPCGFTTVTASGEKYRVTTDWPTAYCEYSANGEDWTAAWTAEATPASAATWTALSAHSAVSLSGTYPFIRFAYDGSVGATANNYACISYTDVTLVPDTNYIPLATLGAEIANYHLNIKLTNSTTSESLKIDTGMLLNSTLEIDCLNKTVKLTAVDNEKDTNKAGALYGFSSVRNQWLDLAPGPNTLLITDLETTGTLTMTIGINWRDRNN